jgi:hypothetical protein
MFQVFISNHVRRLSHNKALKYARYTRRTHASVRRLALRYTSNEI